MVVAAAAAAALVAAAASSIDVSPEPSSSSSSPSSSSSSQSASRGLARRVIACLDVRTNDAGDLVVTKGDQHDVREKGGGPAVRNLGKPVELAAR